MPRVLAVIPLVVLARDNGLNPGLATGRWSAEPGLGEVSG
jgi:hypothetical protein